MRRPRLRTIAGLVVLGAFLYLWLSLAEYATGGCDDGCDYSGHWSEDPGSSQWTTQLRLAQIGVAAAAASAIAWLLRWRTAAFVLAVTAAGLLVTWYPIADKARFGP